MVVIQSLALALSGQFLCLGVGDPEAASVARQVRDQDVAGRGMPVEAGVEALSPSPVVEVARVYRIEVAPARSGQGVGQEKAQSVAEASGQGVAGLAAPKVAAGQSDGTAQRPVDPRLGGEVDDGPGGISILHRQVAVDDLQGLDNLRLGRAGKQAVGAVGQGDPVDQKQEPVVHPPHVQQAVVFADPARNRGDHLLQSRRGLGAGLPLDKGLVQVGFQALRVGFHQRLHPDGFGGCGQAERSLYLNGEVGADAHRAVPGLKAGSLDPQQVGVEGEVVEVKGAPGAGRGLALKPGGAVAEPDQGPRNGCSCGVENHSPYGADPDLGSQGRAQREDNQYCYAGDYFRPNHGDLSVTR